MSELQLPPALATFVQRVDALLLQSNDEAVYLPKIGQAMRELVAQDNWLADQFAQPNSEYYQQYLLYVAPDDSFSVVSFVWGPGQTTPVHDHTVWGVIGMLRGAEIEQKFSLTDSHSAPTGGETATLSAGDVGFVSPSIGDVHKVSNYYDDQVSISIHAYGANIGKTARHVYPEQGGVKQFISGYANQTA